MELNGVGGGLMLAVAAALWMVYLIPNWLKRREYLATERNAVRLQQTIRVLSETAEVPVAQRAMVQQSAPRAVPVPVASVSFKGKPVVVSLATQRLRRTRAVTTLVLLVSAVVGIVQVVLIASTGAVAGAWLVLGMSSIAAIGSFVLLGRLAGVSRARSAARVAPAARTVRMSEAVESVAEPKREWTPVQMPKPVYLSKPAVAPSTMADPVVQVAAEVERAQRPAAREVAPLPTGFAAMGIVDEPTAARPLSDLDAVLARRRAAG